MATANSPRRADRSNSLSWRSASSIKAISLAVSFGVPTPRKSLLAGGPHCARPEAPNGAHFTTCEPDYGRDEAFQKAYATAASNTDDWAAFTDRFLGGNEADYQAAVTGWRTEMKVAQS